MTSSLLRAGWSGFAFFALAVLVTNGTEELVYALVLGGIAALFLVALRGRAAHRGVLVASGLLGALIGLQQTAFLISDVQEGEALTGAVDALGLLTGIAIVAGTVVAWRASGSRHGAAVTA